MNYENDLPTTVVVLRRRVERLESQMSELMAVLELTEESTVDRQNALERLGIAAFNSSFGQ